MKYPLPPCSPRSMVVGGITALLLIGSASAQAQDAATLQSRALAATCAPCHGTAGHAIDASVVPGLAGLPAGTFIEQMNGFKSGTRTATVMHQIAKGFNDAQVDQLAAYFAAQKK